jgi:hypothetical protein
MIFFVTGLMTLCDKSHRVKRTLKVNLLPWPPRSPDLSPIEPVWDMIGQRLKNLAHPPQTIQQLLHEIQVRWDALPQEKIDNQIPSMPRRVTECVNFQGDLLTGKRLNFMFGFSD